MPTQRRPATDEPDQPPADVAPLTSRQWIAAAEAAGIDPTPTPITWRTLPGVVERTWRTERINHRTVGRQRTFSPGRVLSCVRPSLERPIFLIGAARSGTTFLGDAIGRIAEVSYHHEPVATKLAGRYVFDGSWSDRRARVFFRTVYSWLLRYQLDGGLRFAEKTPTNAFLVPFLDRTFPDAQFIHLIRDGRDVAASHIQRPWLRADSALSRQREPGGYLHGPWAPWWVTGDARDAFQTGPDELRMSMAWRRYTEAALADGPGLGPDRYREVRYEALMADPAAEGVRLLDFLRVDDAASRQAFLAAMGRADPRSVGTWRMKLKPDQVATIETDSGHLLRQLGYLEP